MIQPAANGTSLSRMFQYFKASFDSVAVPEPVRISYYSRYNFTKKNLIVEALKAANLGAEEKIKSLRSSDDDVTRVIPDINNLSNLTFSQD